jgi:Flp pilus assembly protein TadD
VQSACAAPGASIAESTTFASADLKIATWCRALRPSRIGGDPNYASSRMKSVAFGLGILIAVAACGGPEATAPKDYPCPDGTRVPQASMCKTSPPPPADTTPPPSTTVNITPPAPTTDGALPPPKPTTIPLAKTGDEKLDAMLADGDKAFEAGDLAKASTAYDGAKKAFPKKAAPIVGVARVKIAKASPALGFASAEKNVDVMAASKDLQRAVEMDPNLGAAHVELGRAYLLLGNAPQAEAALRKGARMLPDDAEARSALGVALLATGKTEEALTELTKARDLDPGSAARRGNLGTVLFMRGKVADAIKEYEVQARLAPDDARAHSDLGTALLAQSDFTRAIPELRKAIQLDPKRATFHSNLGYALQLEGKLTDAIAEYREAIKIDAKLASAWINLATALSRDPKTRAEARQALKTAEKLDPTDPRVKANLEELDSLEKQGTTPPKKP